MITWLKRLFRRPSRKDEALLSGFVVHEIVEQAEGTRVVVSLLDTDPVPLELFYGAVPEDSDEVEDIVIYATRPPQPRRDHDLRGKDNG